MALPLYSDQFRRSLAARRRFWQTASARRPSGRCRLADTVCQMPHQTVSGRWCLLPDGVWQTPRQTAIWQTASARPSRADGIWLPDRVWQTFVWQTPSGRPHLSTRVKPGNEATSGLASSGRHRVWHMASGRRQMPCARLPIPGNIPGRHRVWQTADAVCQTVTSSGRPCLPSARRRI